MFRLGSKYSSVPSTGKTITFQYENVTMSRCINIVKYLKKQVKNFSYYICVIYIQIYVRVCVL